MILINLLPHREAARKRRKEQFFTQLALSAMLGGVSGHAGLFSSANDLAKLFQMLLNGGRYNGRQLFKPETVREMTARVGRSWQFDRTLGILARLGAERLQFGDAMFQPFAVARRFVGNGASLADERAHEL